MNGNLNLNELNASASGDGNGESPSDGEHHNIVVFDDPRATHHVRIRIKETSKARWERFLHGGKWQNFASGIATGAAYICLSGIYWHPDWLTKVETALWLLDCLIFFTNFVLIFVSARIKKRSIIKDFTDPSIALVVPLVTINFATICIGIYQYAHVLGDVEPFDYPGHYIGVYWLYFGFALATTIPVTFGWFGSVGKTHELSSFSLTGCFLVFPVMLVGTMAVNALERVPARHPQTLAILVSGYILQGIGFGVASCFIIVSQYRAIRYGFNRGASAASGFLACGPMGYTALVLLRLGDLGRNILPLYTPMNPVAAEILYYGVLPAVFFLVGLNIYFFIFNFVPWAVAWRNHLALNPAGCWPITFPNSGLVLTMTALGELFDSTGFRIIQVIMAGFIVTCYAVIFICWIYRLIWPADKELKNRRSAAWNQEHISFWSSWREADEAEREYYHRKKISSRRNSRASTPNTPTYTSD